ncbi:MAG: ABATE domain-containing protein, partial [Nocardioidaceae bacterium]|nr:ABATE domain-containing protein [Nocardioidaceae bacterium]
MMFSHDTELSLHVVVAIVNTDPACAGVEGLPDAAAVQAFVEHHHVSGVDPADFGRLTPLYEVRSRLRELFGVGDDAKIAQLVNSLVAEAPMSPRLSEHDGY